MPHIGFDRAAGYYDASRGFPEGVPERIRDAIVALTGARPNTRFLELGVGTGRIGLPFIEEGHDFTGVDISRPMMAQLLQKLAPAPGQTLRYRLVEGDITRLPLADGSHDVAIAVHVLHLVEGWQRALQDVRRVLRRPGGWLLIARDEHKPDGEPSARELVNQHWDQILSDLGIDRTALRPGIGQNGRERDDGELNAYLQELGARVELRYLIEHPEIPLSPRQMAQRHIDRMYSSDWMLPDDIHATAARRLADWIASGCPDPDVPRAGTSRFRVLAARW